MYSFMEHSDRYSKASGSLWQKYKDDPAEENFAIANSDSFESKVKITRKIILFHNF